MCGQTWNSPLNFVLFTLGILSLYIFYSLDIYSFFKMTMTLNISSCFGKGSDIYENIFREGNIYATISWMLISILKYLEKMRGIPFSQLWQSPNI